MNNDYVLYVREVRNDHTYNYGNGFYSLSCLYNSRERHWNGCKDGYYIKNKKSRLYDAIILELIMYTVHI